MPHPESEHGLRVQLATALRERDEARERCRFFNCGGEPPCGKCITCQWDEARESLAAARRECEGLRAMLLNDPKVGSWWQCGNCDGWLVPSGEESNATCAFCAPLRAALAAPAEGT